VTLALVACTQPRPEGAARSAPVPDPAAGVQPTGVIRLAWPVEPESLNPKLTGGSGVFDTFWVFNSFLTYYDIQGRPHPMLAQEIPTQENGGWRINPDGTMVTTYRLRDTARWHDGHPIVAADFALAFDVYLDPLLPIAARQPEPLMERVEAPDPATLVITWKQPYLRANLLGYRELSPLPRHLLEEKYRSNHANFATGEEWTTDYVGTGPYRVERWTQGSQLLARAHRGWALGPPRIDLLDVRFIPSASAQLANLLAGELDMIDSPSVGATEAATARDQWVARGEGYLKNWEARLNYAEFQYREVPNWQRAVTDVRVRQALSHAIDREALTATMTEGLGVIADAFVIRSDPLYPEVDRAITKYPYDPGRANELLREAGWRRPDVSGRPDSSGRDGSGLLSNDAGRTLDLAIMSTTTLGRSTTIIGDYWKAVGANPTLQILSQAGERDREARVSFAATQLAQRGISIDNFHFISSQVPTREAGYAESNRGSFRDADVDRLHNLSVTTLNERARAEAEIALHKRMSELATYIPLHYSAEVLLARNKLKGPAGAYGPQLGVTWNVWQWELVE
jgi:ABC-type transport system substrate-binding protein